MQPPAKMFAPSPATLPALPLLKRFRLAARSRGDSEATANGLVGWSRAFIPFHNKHHPSTARE
jgi:hypothetical protein